MRPASAYKLLVVAASCVGLAAPTGAYATQETASGKVTGISPAPVLARQLNSDGSVSYCEIWGGTLTTRQGQTIAFHIETAMSGDLSSAGGLVPTDPHAVQTTRTLQQGWGQRQTAVATISYVDSEIDCGYEVTNAVTSASLTFPNQKRCLVPKLKGKPLARAKEALKKAQCAVGHITVRKSLTAKGLVISSSPKAGRDLRGGTPVALAVSRGKR
jgi:PASTA domain-containing protein